MLRNFSKQPKLFLAIADVLLWIMLQWGLTKPSTTWVGSQSKREADIHKYVITPLHSQQWYPFICYQVINSIPIHVLPKLLSLVLIFYYYLRLDSLLVAPLFIVSQGSINYWLELYLLWQNCTASHYHVLLWSYDIICWEVAAKCKFLIIALQPLQSLTALR